MITLDEVLAQIDPRDSDSAIKLFNWLQENARLMRVGSLDNVGYLCIYQEPKGTSREGWTYGGTQGDRIVEEALEKAQANGVKTLRGLCKKCLSPISMTEGGTPLAESPRPEDDPSVCTADNALHEFIS